MYTWHGIVALFKISTQNRYSVQEIYNFENGAIRLTGSFSGYNLEARVFSDIQFPQGGIYSEIPCFIRNIGKNFMAQMRKRAKG